MADRAGCGVGWQSVELAMCRGVAGVGRAECGVGWIGLDRIGRNRINSAR